MPHHHDFFYSTDLRRSERRTLWVVLISAFMVIIEVIAGWMTGSISLLADGWHMLSHTFALGLAYATYRLVRSHRLQKKFTFGAGKLIPLGGYTSALLLFFISLYMLAESCFRLFEPRRIEFSEALYVAVLGLVVNIISAIILSGSLKFWRVSHVHQHRDSNHRHETDHNLRGSLLHVLSDALTSITAILALILGKIYDVVWFDAIAGGMTIFFILSWSLSLMRVSAYELLDGHAVNIDQKVLTQILSQHQAEVEDLHVWRVAPGVDVAILVIHSLQNQNAEYYRQIIQSKFSSLQHVTIEMR